MPKIFADNDGNLILPKNFMERRLMRSCSEYWLDEREGDLILHPRIPNARKLYIEPTTVCNLKCSTCIRNVWGDPIDIMTQETFDKILGSLDDLPELKRVVFTGFGEPLSHPHILDMVEAIRKRDLSVTIGSNGLLLTSGIARELVKMGVDRLVVSVDGVNPMTYDKVRGADLTRVLDNLHHLNEIKEELNTLMPALGIEFVALRSNYHELEGLTALAMKLKASRVLVSNVLPYSEDMKSEILYGHQPQDPFKSSGFPVQTGAFIAWGNLELPRMHWGAERRCRFVNDHSIVVGWDGGVAPCYALSHNYSYYAIDGRKKEVTRYVLGNVNDSP